MRSHCAGSKRAFGLPASCLRRQVASKAKKSKGGTSGEAQAASEGAGSERRQKALQKAGLADEQPQKRKRQRGAPSTTTFAEEERSDNEDERDDQFESRLTQLAASSSSLQQAQPTDKGDAPLSSGDAYANPPSLLDTVRGAGKKEGAENKVNPFGTGAVGLLATAVIVAALVIGALGLDNNSTSQAPQPQLTDDASDEIRRALKEYEAELAERPASEEALEAAGVLNAELGNFAEAEKLLARFTEVNAKDPQAWRLLAEVRSKLGERPAAVAAYKEAYATAEADIKVLKGYAEALVAAARPADAVRVVEGAQGVARKAVEQRGPDGVSEDGASLSPIEVDLLLAKVYSQWRGHTGDAFAVYDRVIKEHENDFRGYLAKGVLLRKEGRKGEAERVFLQARYLAPKNMRGIVDRIAQPQP